MTTTAEVGAVDSWRQLPMLLTRKQVIVLTGMTRHDLDAVVESGRVRVVKAKVKRKFLKSDVLKLMGVQA